jgi:hypothetical protein
MSQTSLSTTGDRAGAINAVALLDVPNWLQMGGVYQVDAKAMSHIQRHAG